jgi:hypothetical protein
MPYSSATFSDVMPMGSSESLLIAEYSARAEKPPFGADKPYNSRPNAPYITDLLWETRMPLERRGGGRTGGLEDPGSPYVVILALAALGAEALDADGHADVGLAVADRASDVHLGVGFGRIVASEREVQNMLANLV